jgi:hypothetical protein
VAVVVPDSVTSIGESAFADCKALRYVQLSSKLTELGAFAFSGCTAMTGIVLPESLTSLSGTFSGCTALRIIAFYGHAPSFGSNCFAGVTATALIFPVYSWTDDVKQDYGGTITWVPYGETADEYTITLTDKTKGAAQTSLDLNAKYSGDVSFTVSCGQAVLVAVKNGDAYTVLACKTEGEVHSFTLTVTENTEIALVLKGDANLDGSLDLKDNLRIKKYVAGDASQISDALALLAGNVNGDEAINLKDMQAIKKAIAGAALAW